MAVKIFRWKAIGPLFLVLDEYLNWVLSLGDKDRRELIAKLVRVGAIGREVNCRLLLATQRPGTREAGDTGLPGNLKAQLRCRIAACGQMGLDSLEARMAFDDDAYAHRMPSRLGAGFVKLGRHEVPFVVPWLADPTDPDTSERDRAAAWALLEDFAPSQGHVAKVTEAILAEREQGPAWLAPRLTGALLYAGTMAQSRRAMLERYQDRLKIDPGLRRAQLLAPA